MRDLLRPTLMLGGSSIVTIGAGVATAKVWATLVGPDGVGTIGLLQSLIAFSGLAAGLGISTVMVRELALAAAQGRGDVGAAVLRAARRLIFGAGLACLFAFIAASRPIAAFVLGTADDWAMIAAAGAAVMFNLLSGVETATLNGNRRVAALAASSALGSLASAVTSVGLVMMFGRPAIGHGIAAGALATWAIAATIRRRFVGPTPRVTNQVDISSMARRLVAVGVPYAVSLLVGSAVQLAIPIMVLHRFGPDGAGHYRAASLVSVGYLAFMLAAMAQDYYPRLSTVADDPPGLARMVDRQQRFLLATAIPLILIALAVVPIVIPILYSPAFSPATGILELQLVGDLLKLPAWAVAFVLLVQQRRAAYLAAEVFAGIALLGFAWVGIGALGLTGVGLAYLLMYGLYYPLVWGIARRRIPLRADRWQVAVVGTFVAGAVIVSLETLGFGALRPPLTALVAILATLLGIYLFMRDLAPTWLRPWRRPA